LVLSVPLSRFTSRVGGGSAFYVRPRDTFEILCESDWQAEIIGDLDFAERKFVADLSSFSFAGSDAGERELPRDLSAEIFVGWFYEDLRNVA
jgi:hypothetical protein